MKFYLLLLISCFLMSCQSSQSSSDSESDVATTPKIEKEDQVSKIKVLPPKQFDTKMKAERNLQIIDVRTAKEYKAGYIGTAQNMNVLENNFSTLAKEGLSVKYPVYVYCQKGGRSAKAAKILQDLGFKEIYDLAGGYSAWSQAAKTVLPDTVKVVTQ